MVMAGFTLPAGGVAAPGGGLLILEQGGRVWRVVDGERQVWLDLSDRVGTCHQEQGLLGLALDAGSRDDRVYVAYTDLPCTGDRKGDLVLARLPASRDPQGLEVLLRVSQPYRNHNGGQLLFGPDGFLYVGVGDGGDHGDPHRNGQDRRTLLGKVLRLDVSGPHAYAIPDDNPFVGQASSRGEIWLYGLRNPWRFDIDHATGDLWLADVGQNSWEEVNHLPLDAQAGANLGWSLFEGDKRFRSGSRPPDLVFPAAQYRNPTDGCAVIGGPFLRGAHYGDLDATYLFADFCSGRLWGLREVEGGYDLLSLMDTGLMVTGFAVDGAGAVYLTHWNGSLHRLTIAADATAEG